MISEMHNYKRADKSKAMTGTNNTNDDINMAGLKPEELEKSIFDQIRG